jgi:hypothetical protein
MQENHKRISDLCRETYEKYQIYNKPDISKHTGFGKIAEDQKFFWIRMPKCANTFVNTHIPMMREIDYQADYLKITSDEYTGCVILRDPMERWISGSVSHFLNDAKTKNFNIDQTLDFIRDILSNNIILNNKNYYTSIVIEYTIEKLVQDYHGLLQTWRLYPCNPNNIDFFYMNDKLGHQLNHYFRIHNIATTMNNQKINSTEVNVLLQFFQEFIFDHANQKYKEKIMEILKPDYELISLVNFYAK